MSKVSNLGEFMADLASAIREKTGTTELINPQEFSQKIKDIKGGGSVVVMPPNDVIFIDYDGTILHSYSKDEFLAIEELPPLPEREGLICQEWNWTLADAKEYVGENEHLVIGATYITDDGKTRLYISLINANYLDVTINLGEPQGDLLIEWGDGASETIVGGAGNQVISHSYPTPNYYCIAITSEGGASYKLGTSTNDTLLGSTAYNNRAAFSVLRKVEIGNGVIEILSYGFAEYATLETITMPKEVTEVGVYGFKNCRNLRAIVLPSTHTSIGAYTFDGAVSMRYIAMPKGMTSIGATAFNNIYAMQAFSIPNNITSIPNKAFYYCSSLRRLNIPEGVTEIKDNSFYFCQLLRELKIPASVKSMGASCFGYCYGLNYCDFSSHTTIPTIANYNFVSNYPSGFKIIVPDSLYDSWIVATNWSYLKSVIIKKSAWDASQA